MKLQHYLFVGSILVANLGSSTSWGQIVAYDNWAPNGWTDAYPSGSLQPVGSPTDEFGDEINLAPDTPRLLNDFSFQYSADNSAGNINVTVRLYINDGPLTAGGFPTPNTVLYNSGTVSLPLGSGAGSLTLSGLNVTVPDSFTWTLQFGGLANGQTVGSAIYGTQTVGSSYGDFWRKINGQWSLDQFADASQPGSFGARATVVPEPAASGIALLTAAALSTAGLKRWGRRRSPL